MGEKRKSQMAFVLLMISMLSLPFSTPIASALSLHIDIIADRTPPQPEPEVPEFAQIPPNITLEYGSRFGLQVNLTGSGTAAAWAISDTTHFRIGGGWGSTQAVIKDTMLLPIGIYYLRVTVWDQDYNSASTDFWITVADSKFPLIESPGSIEFIQGADRTRTFVWHASDANPISYLITLNGGLLEQGNWTETEQDFEVWIGHLRKGTYTYELTLTDIGNNILTDIVTVSVFADESVTEVATARDYAPNRVEQYTSVGPPNILFIEVFAIVVLSGLVGLVMMAAVVGGNNEFGFN